jgi:SHAQKYF class myb-like DNA-binding protein
MNPNHTNVLNDTKNHFRTKHNESEDDNRSVYKWTTESHRRFAVATLALGISTVTPRYIERVLCDSRLNREKIGSHL